MHLRRSTSSTVSISDSFLLDEAADLADFCSTSSIDTSADNGNKHRRVKKSISFEKVEIREYPYVLGDNPSVSCGPPLSLDWSPQSQFIFDLDEYETAKSSSSCSYPPRTLSEMRLNDALRLHILQSSGYALSEIAMATVAARRVQDKRQESIDSNMRLMRFQQRTRTVRSKLPSFSNVSRNSFGNKEGFVGKRKNKKNLKRSSQPRAISCRSCIGPTIWQLPPRSRDKNDDEPRGQAFC